MPPTRLMSDRSEVWLQRRRPVWLALSELFLDTEVRPSIAYAALTCLESGYDGAELERIWVHEVSPVLRANLMSIAGVWAGFDGEWLERQILRRRKSWFDRFGQRLNRTHWDETKRIHQWLLTVPDGDRRESAHQISRFVWYVFDAEWAKREILESPQEYAPLQRTWSEAVRPLIIALHVKEYDPPLEELLARGQSVVDSIG